MFPVLRVCFLVALIVLCAASFVTPGRAATPQKVIVEGPGDRVAIFRESAGAIVQSLCSEERAGSLRNRPHYSIEIVWTETLKWKGRFYPPFVGRAAAVHIPDWKLYSGQRVWRCDRRLAGAEAVRILLRETSTAPVVIAVIERGGMNVLHSDFRLDGRQVLRLPGVMPPSVAVKLPRTGSFEDRTQAIRRGALGNLKLGTLYRLQGTRIIGIYAADEFGANTDITADRFHATGTTSAAVGLVHGTNPNALLVFVPDTSREAWDWLAEQRWIDVISTSYYSFSSQDTCIAAESIRRITEQGRLVFSAIGNGEQAGAFFTPSGVPESYQVGGVDDSGRSYRPQSDNPFTPTRPYETGDRFDFPAATADALTGSMDFGGTSGATPSTAGRAAELISFARSLLGSTGGLSDGALAASGSNARLPDRGPLKDGKLTSIELVDLMHHTATPAETATPLRYLIEGYGAFQHDAVQLAKRVLSGEAREPERPDEDRMHGLVESGRAAFFPEARCG